VTREDSVSLVSTSGGGWFHARTPADRARLLELLEQREGKFVYDTSAERMTDFEALRIHVACLFLILIGALVTTLRRHESPALPAVAMLLALFVVIGRVLG
jgi:hypothetical protein